jgi:hypothetical protein
MLRELAPRPLVVSPDTVGNLPKTWVIVWLMAVRSGAATVPATVAAAGVAAAGVAAGDVFPEAAEVLVLPELQALARVRPANATSTGASLLSCLFMPLPSSHLGEPPAGPTTVSTLLRAVWRSCKVAMRSVK